MSYRTILVHLDGGRRSSERVDLAIMLARRYDAYLVGLFGLQRLAVPIDPNVAPMWMQSMLAERRAAADRAAREFHDKVAKERYAARSEWHDTLADGFEALVHHARHADLVVAGQPDRDGEGVPASFSHELVMSVGRPVLYVPRAGRFEHCGSRVLVPWNGSREAARAVEDAVPFLQRSVSADVVTFGDDPAADSGMAAYLARHDAAVSVSAERTNRAEVGSAILARAAERAADLIVMGAYSHSRLRELVLGGATRAVFRSMTVPTLMSH
jgi:nucleotide-binding universal stress UspA family protein